MSVANMYAQFNTIGDVTSLRYNKYKQKDHPSEQPTPKDSLNPPAESDITDSDTIEYSYKSIVEEYMSVSYPLKNIKVNSKYGMRMHPVYHKYMMHNGIDLHARHEDILSMFPGRVLRVGYDDRSGKYVTIQTANYTISYCHLSQQYVKVGEYVRAGQAIGFSGNTGKSTGEHLHLTTKKDGKSFDPSILLDYIKSKHSLYKP